MYPTELFEDLKIIELSSVLAGPLVGSFFAELGADVIKIENAKTNGDVTRQWHLKSENKNELSAYYQAANYGKKSLLLDLTQNSDKEKLSELLKDCSIVISNYLPKQESKFAISYSDISKINPNVIFINLYAYSSSDDRPGYDVVMQAETGYISMTGLSENQLAKVPIAFIDVLASHQLKEALLIALLKKMKTGKGSHIHVSLYQSAISSLINQGTNFLIAETIPKPIGTAHPNISPYGDIFHSKKTQDKFVLAVGSDAQFDSLCQQLEIDASLAAIFSNNQSRVKNRQEVIQMLQTKFSSLSKEEIIKRLENGRIPFGFIKSMDQVFDTALANEMLLTNEHGNKTISNIAFEFIQ